MKAETETPPPPSLVERPILPTPAQGLPYPRNLTHAADRQLGLPLMRVKLGRVI